MEKRDYDWASIAETPKFINLHKRKTAFLVGLWCAGSISYLFLIVGAAYAPGIFSAKIFGRMNFGYVVCTAQFFIMLAIATYYTYRANTYFDPLTKDVVDEICGGGKQ